MLSEKTICQKLLSIESFDVERVEVRFAPDNADNFYSMLQTEGQLVLKNLKLIYADGSDDPNSLRSLIQLDGGSLEASDCRLVLGPSGTIINASRSPRVELRNCKNSGRWYYCFPNR